MRIKKAMLVFRKDWLEISRNWQILLPMLILPLLFVILFPLLLILISGTSESSMNFGELENILKNLPQNMQSRIRDMTPTQIIIYIMALYLFAPFFLIIPVMISGVIASDSFAGEKERKTIEALLATPLTDEELFLGKMLVSFIPSIAITIISFLIYLICVDVLSLSVFDGVLLLPNLDWILLIFGLAPTMALTSIGVTVMISAKVKGVREAQQISGILMIPILALIFGQVMGALILEPFVILLLIGIFIIIDVVVFKMGVRIFEREKILSEML